MKPESAEAFAWRVRGSLYRQTRETGAVPTRGELGVRLDAPDAQIAAALRFLADAHVLVLDEQGDVRMAHPFSAVPTPYRVETPAGAYWANCAWDAVAIPLLLATDGRAPTICPQSGVPFDLSVAGVRAGPTGAVVRFLVPARSFWDDIGYT